MKNRICAVLVLLFVISMYPIFAYSVSTGHENSGSTTVIALSDKVSSDIIKEIENGVFAIIQDEDGKDIPLDCTVTIREMPQVQSSKSIGTHYSMEIIATASDVKVKSATGDYNTTTVTCSANITMEWIDGPGFYNSMERLYGGVNMVKGKCYSGRVQWGNDHNRVTGKALSGNGDSFDFDPEFDIGAGEGIPLSGNLHAHYQVDFHDDAMFDLLVCVNPTIFD